MTLHRHSVSIIVQLPIDELHTFVTRNQIILCNAPTTILLVLILKTNIFINYNHAKVSGKKAEVVGMNYYIHL